MIKSASRCPSLLGTSSTNLTLVAIPLASLSQLTPTFTSSSGWSSVTGAPSNDATVLGFLTSS